MEYLRRLFGRRPVDIAWRQLRKAELQLLEVERDLEMNIAARNYLVGHITRLDAVVKSDGMCRTNFIFPHPSPMVETRLTARFAAFGKALSKINLKNS